LLNYNYIDARSVLIFLSVVEALRGCGACSNVYLKVIVSSPRVAVAVGEKYFFRIDNYLAITVIAIDGVTTWC
jgi:hypothetical protein